MTVDLDTQDLGSDNSLQIFTKKILSTYPVISRSIRQETVKRANMILFIHYKIFIR